MGKKATKAADNMFCIARYEAANQNSDFSSREKAAELIGMDRTRLARIELGQLTPYPEEVVILAEKYGTPELCNRYCANECPIGENNVSELDISEFDRLALKVLGSLTNIDALRSRLIAIAEDGVVDDTEIEEFENILEALDRIAHNAQSLKLWAEKNVGIKMDVD